MFGPGSPKGKRISLPTESANLDPVAALRQQLLSDRMFGVDSVPFVPRVSTPVAPATDNVAAAEDVDQQLRVLDEEEVKNCRKCSLCETRTNTVFGQGNPRARLVFVGEAPGFDEDRQGLAFVGKAGQLLTRMIEGGMGIKRDDVFICNVLKCRPPNNRDPSADEILACSSYLQRQLELIHPEVIVTLGSPASKTLLNTAQGIGRLRGRFHEYFFSGVAGDGPSVPVMPTYHPAYLLRSPGEKAKTWEDLQMVMARLGLPAPKK